MEYTKVVKAKFISRENRFVASVQLYGSNEAVKVHVKNTGRCKELLVPGATVWLEDFEGRMGGRKMRYSLVCVEKENAGANGGRLLINMDSQAPNKVVQEVLEQGMLLPGMDSPATFIKPEHTFGKSRFDFYIEWTAHNVSANKVNDSQNACAQGNDALFMNKAFIEVKGVTLEDKGFARFPDAPTERGLKHVNELIDAVQAGYKGYIIFVIQMNDITGFGPNYETHPAFGEALLQAKAAGVNILAYDCTVTPDSLIINTQLEDSCIHLNKNRLLLD